LRPTCWDLPWQWTTKGSFYHSCSLFTNLQVGELLPRLEPGSDYFLQPSLTQLAAMAREEPDSLAHVANFTVGRPGVGSVRWLEEVDVRGVDVEDLVRLSRGGVEVRTGLPPCAFASVDSVDRDRLGSGGLRPIPSLYVHLGKG